MIILSKDGLNNIANYKYYPCENSFMDNKLLGVYQFFLNFIPLWMAPNLVTILGLGINILSFLFIWIYDTQLNKELPWWVYVYNGLSIYAYNILDALDGKQARRTNSSSGLGACFDHSCDAFATLFSLIIVFQMFTMGPTLLSIVLFMIGPFIFFIGSWEEYHTHVVRTSFHGFGLTELQFITGAMNFLTAIFGTNIWLAILPTPQFVFSLVDYIQGLLSLNLQFQGLNLVILFFVFFSFMTLIQLILIVYTILRISPNIKKSCKFIIPCLINTPIILFWYGSELYSSHAFLVLFLYGICTAFITSKIIIFSNAKMDYPVFHWVILISLLFPLYKICYIMQYFEVNSVENALIEKVIYVIEAIFVFLSLIIYFNIVVNEICKKLNIKCFSLKKSNINTNQNNI